MTMNSRSTLLRKIATLLALFTIQIDLLLIRTTRRTGSSTKTIHHVLAFTPTSHTTTMTTTITNKRMFPILYDDYHQTARKLNQQPAVVGVGSSSYEYSYYVNLYTRYDSSLLSSRTDSSSNSSIDNNNSSGTDSNNSNSSNNDKLFDYAKIAQDVFQKDTRPVILFDGVCNLCNGGVNFALDNDSVGYFRFASLQSTIGKSLLLRSGKKADDISSIVLVTQDKSYFKSDAVLRIASKLDGSPIFPVVGTVGRILPSFLRNIVYDFVADNRYRFGESEQCRLDFGEFDDRFFKEQERNE